MYNEEEYPDFEEYGRYVYLNEPYKRYTGGYIVGRSGSLFAVQFSSGLTIQCYRDEFEFA